MDIKYYLFTKSIKLEDFAKSIACSKGWMYDILRGKHLASEDLIQRIVEKTKGSVTREDIESLYYKTKKEKS